MESKKKKKHKNIVHLGAHKTLLCCTRKFDDRDILLTPSNFFPVIESQSCEYSD